MSGFRDIDGAGSYVDGSGNVCALPPGFNGTLPTSGGTSGKTTKAMADTDQTISSGEAEKAIIQTSGALTDVRTLTFPAPATEADTYSRLVVNGCTSSSPGDRADLYITTGSGLVAKMAPGQRSEIEFSTAGAVIVAGSPYRSLNVLDFGAIPYESRADAEGGTDSSAAFQDAMDAAGTPNEDVGQPISKGGEVIIPPGYYRIANNIYLRRSIYLHGLGGGNDRTHSTRLVFDRGVWFEVQDSIASTDGGTATSFRMSDIHFMGSSAGTATIVAGVRVFTKGSIIDCGFSEFLGDTGAVDPETDNTGIGLLMDGSSTHNCNCSKIIGCRFENNGRAGFFIRGNNGSQCLIANCVHSSGDVGFEDHSFLGNQYVSNLVEGGFIYSYVVEGAANRTSLFGCYAEGGCGPCALDSLATVWGGNLEGVGITTFSGGFSWAMIHRTFSTCFQNRNLTNYAQTRFVGGHPNTESLDGFYYDPGKDATYGDLDVHLFGFNHDVAGDYYYNWGFGNSLNPQSYQFTAARSVYGPQRFRLPRGLHLGKNEQQVGYDNFRHVTCRSADPSADSDQVWQVGDYALDSSGNSAGWRCMASGGKGTTWNDSTQYDPGKIIEPTNTSTNPYIFLLKDKSGSGTAYTTDVSEPTWPTAFGDTVTDGGCVWMNAGAYTATFVREKRDLYDANIDLTSQSIGKWRDSAITGTAAAKTGVDSTRVSTTTAATTANQVLATIALNNNTTVVIDVIVNGKLPSSTSGTTCKLSGSFTRSGSTVTRLGSDDVGTPKDTGSLAGSTFDLNINSTSIEVRATPATASSTNWGVVWQLVEASN